MIADVAVAVVVIVVPTGRTTASTDEGSSSSSSIVIIRVAVVRVLIVLLLLLLIECCDIAIVGNIYIRKKVIIIPNVQVGQTKLSDFQVSISIKQQIFNLQVLVRHRV